MSWEQDILKKLRTERNMTQKEFANFLFNIPLTTYQQWESGKRTPPNWTIKLIIDRCKHSTNGHQISFL